MIAQVTKACFCGSATKTYVGGYEDIGVKVDGVFTVRGGECRQSCDLWRGRNRISKKRRE
jgi:hypothetical protein